MGNISARSLYWSIVALLAVVSVSSFVIFFSVSSAFIFLIPCALTAFPIVVAVILRLPACQHRITKSYIYHLLKGSPLALINFLLFLGADTTPKTNVISTALQHFFASPGSEIITKPELNEFKNSTTIGISNVLTLAILQQHIAHIGMLIKDPKHLVPQHLIDPSHDLCPIAAYFSIPYERRPNQPIWFQLETKLLDLNNVPANINTGLLNPLFLAVKNGYPYEIIKRLVERKEAVNNYKFIELAQYPVDFKDPCYGNSALLAAVARAHTDTEEAEKIVALLLQQPGIYLNPVAHSHSGKKWWRDGFEVYEWLIGDTPLVLALQIPDASGIVQQLLEAGASQEAARVLATTNPRYPQVSTDKLTPHSNKL